MLKNILKVILLILFLATSSIPAKINANILPDFEVSNIYNVYYEGENEYVTIEDIIEIKANNPKYFLPATNFETFQIVDFSADNIEEERALKKSSLKVTDLNGNNLRYSITDGENGLDLTIENIVDVTFGDDFIINISYYSEEQIEKIGNVTNFYIPGISQDTQFTTTDEEYGISTTYSYSANLIIPDEMEEASYIQPSSISKTSSSGERIYSIPQEDRIGATAWIQIGTTQYTYFKLVQKTEKTDNIVPTSISKYSDLISTNIYKLPLPKEHEETEQRVYFTNISPTPVGIEKDSEGNLMGIFEVPANEESEIVIEGYITLNQVRDEAGVPDMGITQYRALIEKDSSLLKYTEADQYWESDHPDIIDIADSIMVDKNTLMEIVRADYQYVIDNFEYSYEKVNGENERYGALAAFNGAQCVCMEYADATIALLRAQGIPARAAIGYGNDPTGAENIIGDSEALAQKIGHQWVQVWVPDYGWLSIDPTWGETGRTYIGGNLDHILWYTIGDSSNAFLGTYLRSADLNYADNLEPYQVYLQSLSSEEFPGTEELITLDEVLTQYSEIEYSDFELMIKTSTFGKALIIVAPVVIIFILSLLFFITLFSFKKKPA